MRREFRRIWFRWYANLLLNWIRGYGLLWKKCPKTWKQLNLIVGLLSFNNFIQLSVHKSLIHHLIQWLAISVTCYVVRVHLINCLERFVLLCTTRKWAVFCYTIGSVRTFIHWPKALFRWLLIFQVIPVQMKHSVNVGRKSTSIRLQLNSSLHVS